MLFQSTHCHNLAWPPELQPLAFSLTHPFGRLTKAISAVETAPQGSHILSFYVQKASTWCESEAICSKISRGKHYFLSASDELMKPLSRRGGKCTEYSKQERSHTEVCLVHHPFSVQIEGTEDNSRGYLRSLGTSRVRRLAACSIYGMCVFFLVCFFF